MSDALLNVPGRGDCLERSDQLGDVFPVYEDSERVYPRSEWDRLAAESAGLETFVRKIKNQGSEGSCASNATCQAMEIAWNKALGLDLWLELSPISLYRWLAPGPGSGSTINGNLAQLRDTGALPVDTPENKDLLTRAGLDIQHVLKATGYYQPFPPGWKATAAFIRALEWRDIATFAGLVSALWDGHPVVYGRAGHAICGARGMKRSGSWTIKYANSWGRWGDGGYGYDSESYVSASIRSYGAWALRAPVLTEEFLNLVIESKGT